MASKQVETINILLAQKINLRTYVFFWILYFVYGSFRYNPMLKKNGISIEALT